MKITLKTSCIVKPAEPTFNGYLPLSILDQTDCIMHIPLIYFYRPIDLQMLDNIVNDIKSSLSKVLVHFYPLAGRLHYIRGGGNRIALECNGKGAELIEAICDGKMEELGNNFPPSSYFYHLLPSIDYKKNSIEELPLLYVQLTRFRCGGLALSVTTSHVVADALSTSHFIMEWARIARGAAQPSFQPFHDRKLLADVFSNYNNPKHHNKKFLHQEYQSPPLLIGQSSNENERKNPTKSDLLKLNKHQVEALKNKANTPNVERKGRPYTRYEVITAHVWRSVCKARRLANEQQTRLSIAVNIRRHMDPPLPPSYYGNTIIDVCAFAFCGELLSNSLTYAANIIREAILQVTSEYVKSAINFLENQKDISKFQDLHALNNDEGPFFGNPNLQVISWLTLPFHELDLGWGKSVCMRPETLDYEGDFILLPSHENDGSIVVSFCLQEQHMEDFIKFFNQHHDEECVGLRFGEAPCSSRLSGSTLLGSAL